MGANSSKPSSKAKRPVAADKSAAETSPVGVVFSDFSTLVSQSSGSNDANSFVSSGTVREQDQAMLSLKVQRDKLKKLTIQLNAVIEREMAAAKNYLVVGQKEKALAILKKKKKQKGVLASTENNLLVLEELVTSVESKKMQNQVYSCLRAGTDLLKQLHQEVSVEDVETLMEESQEMKQISEEMAQLLQTNATVSEEDQCLLDELKLLTEENAAAPKATIQASQLEASESQAKKSVAAEKQRKKVVLVA